MRQGIACCCFVWVISVVLAACGQDPASEIDVVVSETAAGLSRRVDRLTLEVTVLRDSGERTLRTEETAALYDAAERLEAWQVRVRPELDGDPGRVLYRFRATARVGPDARVSAQARVVFLEGRRLMLPLRLDDSCLAGPSCSADETCREGACVGDFVPACELIDGSRPVSCGPLDAGIDSGPDNFDAASDGDAPDAIVDDDGCPRRMEACATACGSTGTRQCTSGSWTPCAAPPETCNARDDDCDGIVDEGFDYVASPPLQITDGPAAREPALAVDATGRIALVWGRSSGDVAFVELDAAGRPVRPPTFFAPDACEGAGCTMSAPAVTWTDGDVAIAYVDAMEFPFMESVAVRVVSARGATIDGPATVQTGLTAAPSPRITWTGTDMGVAYLDGGAVFLERSSGTFATRRGVSDGGVDRPFSMIWTGTGHAFVWASGVELHVAIEADGFPSAVVDARSEQATGTSIVRTAVGFILAGTWDGPYRIGELSTYVLDGGGSPVGPAEPITDTSTAGPTLIDAGGQMLLLWADTRSGTPELSEIWIARLGRRSR